MLRAYALKPLTQDGVTPTLFRPRVGTGWEHLKQLGGLSWVLRSCNMRDGVSPQTYGCVCSCAQIRPVHSQAVRMFCLNQV